MQPLQFLVPVERLEQWAELIPFVILALVVVNVITRFLAHRKQRRQAESGDEDENVSRYLPHVVTTVLLILASFALLLVEPHAGMVMSVLVLGMFLADFFEFESRRVEARNDLRFERPKSAMFAWLLVFLYAVYQSVFYLIAPVWNQVV